MIRKELGYGISYTLDWVCSDGDSARMYIPMSAEFIEISCFSGIGASTVTIHEIDFGVFQHAGVEIGKSFEQNALNIANYLCEKLGLERCEWEAEKKR